MDKNGLTFLRNQQKVRSERTPAEFFLLISNPLPIKLDKIADNRGTNSVV